MFKRWLVATSLVVAALTSGCGVEEPQDVAEAGPTVATQESELTACGYGCPSGYALMGWTCAWGCGPCNGGWNAAICEYIPPGASMWADPATVSVAAGQLGSARVCWKTQGLTSPVWVRVRVNGGPGQLFDKESDNGTDCETAGWIVAGNVYDFSIHTSDSDSAPKMATVRVTGVLSTTSGGGGTGPLTCGEGGSCQSGYDCRCGDVCRRVGTLCP